ncbi:1,4-dihydroxy-2-naphthoate octaprenyltransferase [Bifidobacterium aemilianum]|nr:1,4-dihydroxy-2-naphthoate octaprenyltransferase [Bifidobacterium aemilianum]
MNVRLWINGLRPKTLPASVAPVLIGGAAALLPIGQALQDHGRAGGSVGDAEGSRMLLQRAVGPRMWIILACCILLALCIQIAANFANDYSDGIRGTDDQRGDQELVSGKPQRLVASGVAPRKVLMAAAVSAVAACVFGLLALALSGAWWMVLVGLACLLAGWFYTGGKHPYGYMGLGEVSVFIFFGLVATLGTEYLMIGSVTMAGVLGAVSAGLNAVGLLMLNNYRDIDADRRSGKRTYATMVGQQGARISVYMVYLAAFAVAVVQFLEAGWGPGAYRYMAVAGIALLAFLAVLYWLICRRLAHGDQRGAFVLSGKGNLLSAVCWVLGFLIELFLMAAGTR